MSPEILFCLLTQTNRQTDTLKTILATAGKHRTSSSSIACPYWSAAVLTNVLQSDLFCARRHAVCRPKLAGRKSSSTVRIHQVCRGSPWGLFQVAGTPLSAQQWSMDDSDLAVWPNSVRRLERIISVAGTQPLDRLSKLLGYAVYLYSQSTVNVLFVVHLED